MFEDVGWSEATLNARQQPTRGRAPQLPLGDVCAVWAITAAAVVAAQIRIRSLQMYTCRRQRSGPMPARSALQ